jgi:hypothetical protein
VLSSKLGKTYNFSIDGPIRVISTESIVLVASLFTLLGPNGLFRRKCSYRLHPTLSSRRFPIAKLSLPLLALLYTEYDILNYQLPSHIDVDVETTYLLLRP